MSNSSFKKRNLSTIRDSEPAHLGDFRSPRDSETPTVRGNTFTAVAFEPYQIPANLLKDYSKVIDSRRATPKKEEPRTIVKTVPKLVINLDTDQKKEQTESLELFDELSKKIKELRINTSDQRIIRKLIQDMQKLMYSTCSEKEKAFNDLDSLKIQIDALRKNLLQTESGRASLELALKEAEEKSLKTKTEMEGLLTQLEQAQTDQNNQLEQIKELEADKKEVAKELEMTKKDFLETKTENEKNKIELGGLKIEHEKAIKEREELRTQFEICKIHEQKLEIELKDLQAFSLEQQNTNKNLESSNQTLRKEKEDTYLILSELQAENFQLNEQLKESMAKVNQVEIQINQLQTENEIMKKAFLHEVEQITKESYEKMAVLNVKIRQLNMEKVKDIINKEFESKFQIARVNGKTVLLQLNIYEVYNITMEKYEEFLVNLTKQMPKSLLENTDCDYGVREFLKNNQEKLLSGLRMIGEIENGSPKGNNDSFQELSPSMAEMDVTELGIEASVIIPQ